MTGIHSAYFLDLLQTDKASMLDEVIEYLKQLQAQVQMMSRMNIQPMMLPMPMQQLPMSMMAPLGMGMGMGIGLGMGMDINTINRPNITGISPVLHPAAFMPMTSWDGSGGDRLQAATSAAVMPDHLSAFLACQSQVRMSDSVDHHIKVTFHCFIQLLILPSFCFFFLFIFGFSCND